MIKALFIFFLCFLCLGCAADQPDYGWVAKPKSSVQEHYGRGGHDRDRRYEREYHYNSAGELDSVVEINFGRTVFSNFKHAELGIRARHSYTTFNVVPWDVSVAATTQIDYFGTKKSGFRINSLRVDSLRGDEAISNTTRYPDPQRRGPSFRQWKEYGAHGYLTADLQGDSVNWSGYHYYYSFVKRRPGIVVKTYTSDSSEIRRKTRIARTGRYHTDTVAIFSYGYDSIGELRTISVRTYEGKFGMAYAGEVRFTDIELTDSITAFSRRTDYLFDIGPIGKHPLRYTKVTQAEEGKTYQNTYAIVLDNRYRVIKETTDDSNEVAITYFDDNSVKESRTSVRREGKTYSSIRSRRVRKYDYQKRIVQIDSYYLDSDGDERRTSRIKFKY